MKVIRCSPQFQDYCVCVWKSHSVFPSSEQMTVSHLVLVVHVPTIGFAAIWLSLLHVSDEIGTGVGVIKGIIVDVADVIDTHMFLSRIIWDCGIRWIILLLYNRLTCI